MNGSIIWKKKERLSFTLFDKESFFPSISNNLFIKPIQFAKEITEITDEDRSLITQAEKTLLLNGGIPWVKRDEVKDFDVPISCFDGAEECELFGSYILQQLSQFFERHSVGLYGDDDPAILKGLLGPETKIVKKIVTEAFKD